MFITVFKDGIPAGSKPGSKRPVLNLPQQAQAEIVKHPAAMSDLAGSNLSFDRALCKTAPKQTVEDVSQMAHPG